MTKSKCECGHTLDEHPIVYDREDFAYHGRCIKCDCRKMSWEMYE